MPTSSFSKRILLGLSVFGFSCVMLFMGSAQAQAATPTISNLAPITTATVGASAFTLTVNGTNFSSAAKVWWCEDTICNVGTQKTTLFSSSTKLTATIPTTDLDAVGTFYVVVYDANGTFSMAAPKVILASDILLAGFPVTGAYSNAVAFTVANPVPTLTAISPTTTTANNAAFTLTLTGTNFNSSSKINIGSSVFSPTTVTVTQLTLAIPAGTFTVGGTVNVTVTNPAPGGSTSAIKTLTVNNPTPAISSLNPSTVTAGSGAFNLTVFGSNFVSGSIVRINGANRTTTFVSPGQLTAAILATDISTAGTDTITVFNPTPVGGLSAGASLTAIAANPFPAISSLSPNSIVQGTSNNTLIINGSNFMGTSAVAINGLNLSSGVTVNSSTKITIDATTIFSLAAGSYSFTVTNPSPGGGTSSAANFTVNNPVPGITALGQYSVPAGSAGFSMNVVGYNFNSGSKVYFNGVGQGTTVLSNTQLLATIPAGLLTLPSTNTITVANPAPGGGTSNAATFTVTSNVGTINVVATVVGGGTATFNFTSNFPSAGNAFSLTPNSNSVTKTYANITPGSSYSVTASALPAGWNAISSSCNNGTPSAFSVTAGGTATCTFTYARTGSITIIKNTPGVTTSSTFTFTGNTGVTSLTTSGGTASQTISNLPTGTGAVYNITENAASGWTQSSATCTTGTPSSFTIPAGGSVTCTFTNSIAPGSIKIVKNTVGGDYSFLFTSNFGVSSVGTSGGTGSITANNIAPGSNYNISENALSGWTQNSATCDRGTPQAITVISGQTTTCTFTNTLQGANLIIKKIALGGDNTFNFSLYPTPLNPSIPTNGGIGTTGIIPVSVSPSGSNYSIFETVPSGWNFTSVSCDKPMSAGYASANNIPIMPGDTVTCTFTNTKVATPTTTSISPSTKVAGSAAFAMTVNGANFIAGAAVYVNGSARTTSFVNSGQLTATILASDIATAGTTKSITVRNPSNSTDSNAQTLSVSTNLGSIKIISNTLGGNVTVNFNTNFSGIIPITSAGGSPGVNGLGEQTSSSVVAGSAYSISQTAPAGWTLATPNPLCDNGTPSAVTVIAGQTTTCTFNYAKTPTITITKTLIPSNDIGKFNLRLDGVVRVSNIGNNGTTGIINSSVGNHTVSETAGTGTTLSNYISSIGGDCAYDGTVTLAAGDAKVCTITNTRTGNLTINKTTTGGNGTFNFTVNGPGFGPLTLPVTTTNGSGSYALTGIAPGTWTATETAPSGWTKTSDNCSTVTVTGGTTTTCSVTNAKNTTLTINKVVVPSNDSGKFNLTIDGSTAGTGGNVGNSGTTGAVTVSAGSHTIGETAASGTLLSDYTTTYSGDCSSSTITLATGDNKVCTITNTKKGSITVIVNAPGTTTAFPFTSTGGNGLPTNFSVTTSGGSVTSIFPVAPGTFSLTENVPANWQLNNNSCPSSFTVPAGGNVTCTFDNSFNNPAPAITNITPDNKTVGSALFTMTISGNNFVSGSQVKFDGSNRTTTFSSGTQLTASIPASDMVTAGTHNITVINPSPGGGTSNSITFTVNNLTPVVTSVSPASIVQGTATNVVASGNNFLPNSSTWLYPPIPLAPLGPYTTTIPGSVISSLGANLYNVYVSNPGPGGGMSTNNVVLTVTSNQGAITTDVVTVPSGSSQNFNFTTTGTNYNNFSLTGAAAPNTQQVASGSGYSVAQAAMPSGWVQSSFTCNSGTPSNITVAVGQTITCTATNIQASPLNSPATVQPSTGNPSTTPTTIPSSVYPVILYPTPTSGNPNPLPIPVQPGQSIPAGFPGGVAQPMQPSGTPMGPGTPIPAMPNGGTIQNAQANLVIRKITIGGTGNFDYYALQIPYVPTSINVQTIGSSLAGSGTSNATQLAPGTYTIQEVASIDWTLTSIACIYGAGNTPTGNVNGNSISGVVIQTGSITTCTFTNTKTQLPPFPGGIIQPAQVIGQPTPTIITIPLWQGGWIFYPNPTPANPNPIPAPIQIGQTLPPGVSGTLQPAPVPGQPSPPQITVPVMSGGATIQPPPVTPTTGTITVTKILVPSNDPGKFDLKIGGMVHAERVGNGGTTGKISKSPGTYAISEKDPGINGPGDFLDRYITTFVGDCDPSGNLTLVAGQDASCIITNYRKPQEGTLKIVKTSTNGGSGIFYFNIFPTVSTMSVSNVGPNNSNSMDLPVGKYAVGEFVPVGWDWTYNSTTCVVEGPVGIPGTPTGIVAPNGLTDVDIVSGKTTTCTVSNTNVPAATTGTIKLIKNSLNGGGTFNFTNNFNKTIPALVTNSGNFFRDEEVIAGIPEGIGYRITESNLPARWALTNASCDNGGAQNGNSLESIIVNAGEVTTCTFANTYTPAADGTLEIIKKTVGGDDTFNYSIFPTPEIVSIETFDGFGSGEPRPMPAGTYSITEAIPSGWKHDSFTCDSPFTPGTVNSTSATMAVTITAGQDTVCTFNNSKISANTGSIKIVKNINGDSRSFDFSTNFGATQYHVTAVGGSGEETITGLNPGSSYNITEDVPEGWLLTSMSCNKSFTEGVNGVKNITVEIGKTTTCTFVNTQQKGTLKIVKLADGGDDAFDFAITNTDTQTSIAKTINTNDGSGSISLPNIGVGTYDIAETIPEDWDFTSVFCNKPYSATVGMPSAKNVQVIAGQTTTCTFKNLNNGPAITSINPDSALKCGPSFTLEVTGEHFKQDSIIYFGSLAVPTDFVSATELKTDIGNVPDAGDYYISVVNPGGLTSNTKVFEVTTTGPHIESIIPNSVPQNSTTVNVTITGSGFTSASLGRIDGNNLPTTFTSENYLTVAVPASMLTQATTKYISVTNEPTDEETCSQEDSNSVGFTIISSQNNNGGNGTQQDIQLLRPVPGPIRPD